MLCGVYQEGGICVRHHCGADPPRDIEPPGLVTTVGWRDRESTSYAAADCVKAPAGAARGGFRGIHGGRTASSLPAKIRTPSGGRCLAGSVPSVLVRSRGCSRTPPRPHGSVNTNEKEDKEEAPMNVLLWVLQVALALLYLAGGSYKVFKFDELATHMRALSRGGWRALGVLEMLCAVLLVVPAQRRGWARFDADRNLGTVGTTVKLTTVGAPRPHVTETAVTRADAPKALEYNWGGIDMRWELEAFGGGARLTLWTNIDRNFISMGAAGWHICFDVLERLLAGQPIGRIVGPDAIKFGGWQQLNAEYAKQFGVEPPGWLSRPT